MMSIAESQDVWRSPSVDKTVTWPAQLGPAREFSFLDHKGSELLYSLIGCPTWDQKIFHRG